MDFAVINSDLSYWKKQLTPLFPDLSWNIPEQKTGSTNIIGGNAQGFATTIRISEFLASHYPLRTVKVTLPDSLKKSLPVSANINFTPSTESGSFAKSPELNSAFASTDVNVIIGDLSKNSATAIAISDAIKKSPDKLYAISRDAVDLLATEMDTLLELPRIFIIATMPQLQKIFRAVYYPKMILLSQPIIPTIESLHKFTLSFPATILTFHQDQIIVANGGHITTTPINTTSYSPLNLWNGQLTAHITAMNFFNPSQPLAATTAAILQK